MFRRNQKNLVYAVILLLSFLVLFIRSNAFSSVKFGFIQVLALPARILSVPILEVKKILFYHRTYREYQRLREETDVLKARLVGLEEVIRENTQLEQLLEFKRRMIYSSVGANVIGRDPSRWDSSMIIDRGEADGVRQGMPVINALGVVGKVAEVGTHNAKVILLTDPQFSVAVVVQRSREVGLVSGSLQKGLCRMRYLGAGANVHAGDKIVTSKLSSSFPEGLIVGEITQVLSSPQRPTVECIVKPAVVFSQIEQVLVILK